MKFNGCPLMSSCGPIAVLFGAAICLVVTGGGMAWGAGGDLAWSDRFNTLESAFIEEVAEQVKLTARDGRPGDMFGWSVSISDDEAIIGTPEAAYIFSRAKGGIWKEVKKLTATDGAAGDYFGTAVSIDGNTAIVGAQYNRTESGFGAAYVFERNSGGPNNWGQVKKLTGSGQFGISVSISGDTALVGSFSDVCVFDRNAGGSDNWGLIKKITGSVGWSVSVSGDTAIAGDFAKNGYKGEAYVFGRNDGGPNNWGLVRALTCRDGGRCGFSVSIDGETAIVGAYVDNERGAVAGAAYVFDRNAGGDDNWGEVRKLTASDGAAFDYFGWSVSISGDKAIVGNRRNMTGSGLGVAYMFERNRGGQDQWGEVEKLTQSDGEALDDFGYSVAISDDTAIVGAVSDDENGAGAGAAYVFELLWARQPAWDMSGLGAYSNPVFADLDGDGDLDVIIGDSTGTGKAYENIGSANAPSWVRRPDWDLPDVGSYAAPAFADLDGDGDLDAIIGDSTGTGKAYENTGSAHVPIWVRRPDWDLPDVGSYAAPTFADLDCDGDSDVLIGRSSGQVVAYRNTGSRDAPVWMRHSAWDLPSDVGSYADPVLVDLDGDGDMDLLVGEASKGVLAYRNDGGCAGPVWVRYPVWDAPSAGYRTTVAAGDLDGDGDIDLMTVARFGKVLSYENTRNGTSRRLPRDSRAAGGR